MYCILNNINVQLIIFPVFVPKKIIKQFNHFKNLVIRFFLKIIYKISKRFINSRQYKRPKKCPKYLVKTNCCPTQSCNGSGNRNSRYKSHKSVKSCPLSVGQILNVSLGQRRKSDKVIYKTMTVSETPVVEGFDNRWH